jgi:hypothetical protein
MNEDYLIFRASSFDAHLPLHLTGAPLDSEVNTLYKHLSISEINKMREIFAENLDNSDVKIIHAFPVLAVAVRTPMMKLLKQMDIIAPMRWEALLNEISIFLIEREDTPTVDELEQQFEM